jgi:hypothetical protein
VTVTKPCKTGKYSFHDEQSAKDALTRIRQSEERLDESERRTEIPTRAYECEWCRRWHVTSQEVPGVKRSAGLSRHKPMKRGHGLKRSDSLKRSRLKPVSDQRRAEEPEYEAMKATVALRDRGRCQAAEIWPEIDCAGPRDPHHVYPTGMFPERRCDPEAVKTLCRAHHDAVHQVDPVRARQLGLLKGVGDE